MHDSEGQPIEVALGNPLRVRISVAEDIHGALIAHVFEPQTDAPAGPAA